jgi:hypothetical protein
MKKVVIPSAIIMLAVLALAGWTTFRTTSEAPSVEAAAPSAAIPDYPLDGQFFVDEYPSAAPSGASAAIPDYPLDGQFFMEAYRVAAPSAAIPDYPLDGKFFMEAYLGGASE